MAKMTTIRTEIAFRFRGKPVALRGFPPDRTLLDWLREEAAAKGTKEGCAEGDCGACTVVLSRVRGAKLTYEPVNACILLLGQIDGAELLTVEDLAQGETLHPVQQAMVDHHGSQCGFCTPGIVMSLFAHYHDGGPATPENVNAALAGNLCRCTGYRPIFDAAEAVIDGAPADRFAAATAERIAALGGLPGGDVLVGDDACFFAAPSSEASLAALYAAHPDATLLGGATDVGLWVTKRMMRLRKVIWLGRIAGFDRIAEDGDMLSLGAGVTLHDSEGPLAGLHPHLGRLMSRFGSAQVRASGTVGGNIANGSPIGDLAPALIALDARVELAQSGAARTPPLEAFFLAYGKQDRRPCEYVRALHVPRLKPNQFYAAYKVSKRFDEDISAVMAAFRLDLDGRRVVAARAAYGGMAATPKRGSAMEAALVDVDLDDPASWEAAARAAAVDFQPLSDMRASAAYRLTVAANLVKRALMEAAGAAALNLGDLVAAE
jgi:xanthine dehydrogenase small subunit